MASPVANFTQNEGSALNLSLSSLFTDPEGDFISLNVTGLPGWATYNAATKTITGTPGAGAVNQSHSITVNGSSTGGNASQTFTMTVNDAPDLTAGGGGNAIFAAGGGAVALDSAIALADAEGNFSGGTVRIELSAPAAASGTGTAGGSKDDTLSVKAQTVDGLAVAISGNDITVDGTVVGTIDGTLGGTADTTVGTDTTGKVLLITFNANATTARVQAVLKSLQFENSAGTVVQENRTINLTLTDANGAEETFSTTVEAYNNQRPTTADVALNVNEDAPLTLSASNFAFTDGDAGDTLQAVKITELPTAAQGKLQLNGADISVNAEITKAQIDAGQLKFVPTADYNGTATFKFAVGDGKQFTQTVDAKTATITIAPIDDQPRITANTGRTYATPMAQAILIDPGLALVDPDATGSATGTFADTGTGYLQISITANKTAGDVLSVNNFGTGAGQIGVNGSDVTYSGTLIGTIDGTLDGSSNQALKINLNNAASNDAVQALARAVTIRSADPDPGASAQKTITFTASDGQNANTTGATRIVDFDKVIFDDFDPSTTRNVISSNGANDYINISGSTGSDFIDQNGAFTWEAWAKPLTGSGTLTLFSVGDVKNVSIINTSFSSSSGISTSGTPSVTGGKLLLSPATGGSGSATVTMPDAAKGAKEFTASFNMSIGDGSANFAGDGMSFNYGSGTVNGEEGVTNGLAISFDTYNNNNGDTFNRIDVFVDGQLVGFGTPSGGIRNEPSTHYADFNGTTDVLYRTGDGALDQSGDVTAEAWINPDTYGGAFISLGGPTGDSTEAQNFTMLLTLESNGKIRAFHEYNTGENESVTFSPTISLNQWTHVAVSRDVSTNTYRLYINGSLADTETYTNDPTGGSTGVLSIGAEITSSDTANNAFNGQIDDVRIWDDVRSSSEISANYDKVITDSPADLTANYTFDSSITADSSTISGSQTLTNVGASRVASDFGPQAATEVPFSAAVSYDGSTYRLNVSYDGQNVISNLNLGANYDPGVNDVFSFGVRTGSANDKHQIDNLQITANDAGTQHSLVVINGVLALVTETNEGTTTTSSGVNVFTDGEFHHLAASYNNGTVKLYVDGELKHTATGIEKLVTQGNAVIGATSGDSQSNFWNGLIAEMRVWDSALSDDAIKNDYLPDINDQSGLIGYWTFDGTSTSYTDQSGTGHTASYGGSSNWSQSAQTFFASPNSTEWTVVDGSHSASTNDIAYIDSDTGELVVQNRELVRTAEQLKPSSNEPVHVSGTFKFSSGTDGFMHVLTRADPTATDSFGFITNGLNFSAVEGENRILIDRFVNGTLTSVANSGTGSINLTKNVEYSFDVYDDGSTVRLTVTEVGNSANTATITATDTTDFSGSNYVILTSREDTNSGGEQIVRFDNVNIDQDHVIGEGATFTGTLPSTGLTGTLTFAAIGQPEHGTLNITDATTGAYTYTPSSGYHGQDTFSIQVTDSNGKINVHQVSFAVDADLDVQVAGKHLSFDGSNDYVKIGRGTSDSLAITGDITIEGWIRPNDTNTVQNFVYFGGDFTNTASSENTLYSVGINANGTLYANHRNGSGTDNLLNEATSGYDTTTKVTFGEWNHVSAVRDTTAQSWKLYLNGELVQETTYANNPDGGSGGELYLGSIEGTSSLAQQFSGQMDDVRIWSEARSAEDIRQNYDQQLSGSEANLKAYYQFDDVQNGIIQDQTANNNDGTLGASDTLGDSAEPTVVDPAGGKSLKLDGTDDYVQFTDTYNTGTSFTVETWAWTDPTDTGGHVFSKDSLGSDTSGAANWEIGHGRIAYEKNNANSFVIDPGLQAGTWNHYALVVSDQGGGNSQVKVYVNGELIHTATVDTVSVTTGGFLVGRRGFSNDSNFKGQLDDYRVWNTARTADQIVQNYQKPLAGTETGLIAYLTFDNDTSSVSESVGSNTGTLNGGASITSGSADGTLPPIYGNAIDTVENTTASGYMVTDNAVVGTVTYAIDNGSGGTTTSFTTSKNGTVTIDAETGSWTYTPATNYAGSDSFTLVASGATSGSDSETITVNVAGAGDENSVGMPDGVLQLDGNGDYVNLGSPSQLAFGSNDFTIETWVRTSTTDNTRVNIANFGATSVANQGTYLFIENGKFSWDTFGSADVVSTTNVNDQQWHHVAVTREGTTVKVYVDGNLEASGTFTFTVPQAATTIGSNDAGTLKGELDEFRIWSDARTAQEISANYQKQLAGNENNLTAYYRFDDDPDATTIDNKATATGSALDGTLVGGATIKNIPTHAADFTGAGNYIEVTNPTGGLISGTGSFTYETWIKTDETTLNTIMGTGGTGGNGATMRINNGKVQFNNTGVDAGTGEVFGTSNIADGLWHHVAVVYDSTTGDATVYVDGVAEAVGDAKTMNITSGNLVVGDSNNHSGNNFGGQIANTRFWTTARSADEIAGNMNNVLTGNETGLATQYLYDEKVGGAFVDSAGNNNATVTGTVNIVNATPTVQGTVGEIQENATLSGEMSANDVAGTPTYSVSVTGKTTSAVDADGRVTVETANGGTVSIDQSSGAWTYKPADNWYGTDSFNLTATGDNSTSDSETISVTVNNDAEKSIVINDGQLHTTGDAGAHASGSIGTNTIGNQVTIEFSVTFDKIISGQSQTLLSVFDTTGNNARFVATLTGDGKLQFFNRSSAGDNNSVTTNFTFDADTTYDIAMTYDGATKKVFVNGDLVLSEALSGMTMSNTTQEIRIGTHFDGSSNPASALFDEVKVWSEARTQEQIRDGIDQPIASGTNNLEAYYKFDDQVSATAVQDQSGNNRDLTINGNAKIIDDLKGGLSFDGTDDVVTIADDASLNSAKGTWSTWFKWDTTANPTNGAILMGRHDATTSYNGLLVAVESNGTLLVQGKDADSTNAQISVASSGVNDGAWHQVTVVYDQAAGGINKLYVDGVLVGSVNSSAAWNWGGQSLQIGDSPDTHWTPWKGEIGAVQIYNTQLTDEQVVAQFGNEIDPATSGLIGSYDFTEGTGTTAANDATGGTQTPDATVSGATWIDLDNDTTATTLVLQEDEVATGRLLSNDVPGTPAYGVETAATNGTVTVNADGTWHYKPVANFYGTDTFTLKVTSTFNGQNFSDTETVTVTVNSVDDGNAVQISDGALSLDGSDDRVDLGTSGGIYTGTSSFTYEAWIKPANTGSRAEFMSIGSGSTGAATYMFVTADGKLEFDVHNEVGAKGVTTLTDGNWHHVAAVYDSGTKAVSIYVDGNFEGTHTFTSTVNIASGNAYLGYPADGSNRHYQGNMDEVRIWNDARTAEEIRTNYDQQLAGNESNLQAYYRFDDDTDGNVVNNIVGSNNNGTMVNGADIVDPASGAEPSVHGNAIEIQSSEIAAGSMTGIDVPGTPAYSIVGGTTTFTTANGGSVTIDASTGAWSYDPANGYYGSDSFTLRASSTHNSVNFTDDETVTVTIKSDTNVEAHDGVLDVAAAGARAEIANNSALQITGDLSIETWINQSDRDAGNSTFGSVIVDKFNSYALGISTAGKLQFALYDSSWSWVETNYTVPLDDWAHVALTFEKSSGTAKIYVDGELQQTLTSADDGGVPDAGASLASNTNKLTIGGRDTSLSSQHDFAGSIDDVRVWNDVRSADEIRENYDQKLSGSENGLAGYWNFDDVTGTTVQDGTSNNNDATLAGNARVNNTLGASMEFDGNGDYVSTSGINLANKSFSWEFDAYRDSTANVDLALTSHDGVGGNQHFFHAGYLDGNTFRYSFNQLSGNYRIDYTDTTGPNGNGTDVWNHWAGTYDAESNVARLYLNGELVVTEVFDGDFLGTASLFIASTDPAQSTGHYFDGKLDNVRVWDGVRTGEEIKDNFNTVLTGDQDGKLLANYTFEETTGNTVTNTANSGTYDGTAAGDFNRVDVSPNIYTNAITIEENEVVQGNMNSAGADGSATFSVDTTNAHGTVTLNTSTGRWTYTPHENYNGSASFVLTATGANGTTDSETINVTINADAAQRSPVTNGGVLVLDGADDHIAVADNAALDLSSGFTMETWINLSNVSTLQNFIDKSSGGNVNYRLFVENGHIGVFSQASATVKTADGIIQANEWTHVAASFDGTNVTFYVNGEQVSDPQAFSIDGTNNGPLYIGRDGSGRYVNGMMDDVRIWNDARTATEIQANYDQLVSTGDGLVGNWTFDTTNGGTVADRSGNSLTGTLTNGADVLNLPQKAISLDGGDFINAGAGTGNELRLDGDMTIELWVKPDAISGTQALIALGGKNGDAIAADTYLFGLNLKSDGTLNAFHENGSSEPGVTTIATLSAGEWAHVSVTRDVSERTYTVFINGEAVSTGTYSNTVDVVSAATATNATFKIGTQIDTDGTSLTRTFTGDIADVRVWNTVRTDQQIADYHNQSIAGDVGGALVAHYEFNETTGQTVTDTAGSNNATLGASNAAGTDDPTFVDGTPAIHSLSVAVQENHTASGTMTTNDVVPTSATFGVNSSASHSGTTSLTIANKGTVNIDSTGGWTFTPIDNFNGQVQFYVTASGGGETDAEQITVDVQPVNVTSNEVNAVAAVFDGVDDVLTATPSGMAVGTGSFTMETWFKTTGTTGGLLDLGREVPNGSMKLFLSGGKLAVSRPGLEIINAAELTVNDGNWHHTSVVYDGGTDVVKLYVDGELVKSVSSITYDIQVGEIAIGGYNPVNAGLGAFNGQLADVRMWSTARTSTEVRENYTQKLAGNETGLQAYYTFEDRDGTSVNDVTSNNNDLQVTSVAATLNGTNQGFTVNDDASLNFNASASFTLESWFKTSATPGDYQRILFKNADSLDGGQQYSLAIDANGYAEILFNNNSSGSTSLKTDIKLNDGTWHHVAAVYDNTNDLISIYVDGVLNSTLSTTEIPKQDSGSLGVGYAINQGSSTAGQYFNGQLDDVRIWNTARSAAEIAANFQTTLTGTQSGVLVANYTFEDSTANDSAGSNNGAAVGTPTYSLANHPNSAAGPTYADGGLDLFATSVAINEDTSATGTMTASDVVGTAAYTVTAAAQHGTVSINSSTGEWTYTPNGNYSGSDTFQLQATDGTFTDQETITVTIDADNDPVISPSVLQMDGSGTAATIAHNNALNATASGFTVEFWLQGSGNGAHTGLLDKMNQPNASTFNGWKMNLDANGSLPILYIGDNDAYVAVGNTTNVDDGAWHHIAAVYDGTANTITMYVDGVSNTTPVSTAGLTQSQLTSTVDLLIGNDDYATNPAYDGRMADLRIWSDARTADEISGNYQHQLAGNEANLAAYYTMESADGKTIEDKTSNNLDLRMTDNDGVNSIRLPVSAMNFDGVDDHIAIGALSENISGGFTMEAWVKLDDFDGSWARIFDLGQGSNDDNLLFAFEGTTGKLVLDTYIGSNGAGGSATRVQASEALPLNEWVHIAAVNDGTGNAYIYVNGERVASATGQNVAPDVVRSSNFIGKSNFAGDGFLDGQIADARLWNVARSADEIAANYNHAMTGNEQGLLLNYKFEEIDGTNAIVDSSTNSNTGTVNGGATIVDPRPQIEGNAITMSTADTFSGTMTAADVIGEATFTITSQPTHGSVNLNSDTGDWTYTPNANYVGSDSFTVRATGATSGTDDETISLTVTASTDATNTPTQSALQFDGVDDYVNIGPMSENISGAYTMEAWVYYNPSAFTNNNWMRIIDLGQGENDDNLLLVIDPGSDVFSFDTRNGANVSAVKSDTTAPTGEWVHVAGVNDGAGNGYLYINGDLVKTTTGQQVAQDVVRTNNYIGQSNWSNESPMHGAVADVRIWNDARTSDEIKANYNTTLTGSEDSLVAYYTFEDIENGVVHDVTNKGNDAQIINNSNDPGVAATGPTGDVLQVNGSNNMTTASDPALASKSFTIEFWANRTSADTGDMVYQQGPALGNQQLGIGWQVNTNRFNVSFYGNDLIWDDPAGAGVGEWHHWAITYDVSNNARVLYKDGVAVANDTATSAFLGAGTANIGVNFNGQLDNFRIWHEARTAEDIRDGMSTSYDYDTSNLVVQYTFDDVENSATVLDSAHSMANGVRSNNNDGTLNNGATTADSGAGGGIAVSHLDKAIRFDGTNDYANDPSDAIGALGAAQRTIMLWARSSSEEPQTFVSYGGGGKGQQFVFGLNTWDQPTASSLEGGKGVTIDIGSGAITFQPLTGTDDGQWHHYAVVLPSGGDSLRDLKVYQDGVLLTTISALFNNEDVTINTNASGSTFQLGHHGTDRYFNGDMSEVSVWSTGLTAAQINEYMSDQLSGSETGLTAYWRGSDNGSGAVNDYAGNNDLTLTNGASIVDVAPDITTNSMRISEDTIATGQLAASGTNTSAAYAVQTAAQHGTVTIDSATGVWNYVPTAGYSGTDTFTLRAVGSETEHETVSIRVGQDPVLPASHSLSLDGVDDYVDVGPLTDDISGAFTAEAWIKLDANAFTGTQWMRIFDFSETTGANNNGFLLTTNSTSGELALYTYNGNAATSVTADSPLPLNEWVHVAAVNDGAGNATLYLNGAAIKTGTGQNPLASSTKIYNYIGKSQDSNDTNFKGDIAEARLWNDARTSTEIANSYDKQLNGDEQGLAGYWTFAEGAGNIAHDQSGNSNDASIVGGTHEDLNSISMAANASYKGLILGADADDNDSLSYSAANNLGGRLSVDADGSFEYTNNGADESFDVTITDSDGNQTIETIHIDVP